MDKKFQERLESLLEGAPMAQLARKWGVSVGALRKYKDGQSGPTRPMLEKIATGAGINLLWLITGEGDKRAAPSGTTHQAAASFQATARMKAEPTVHRGIEGAILDWLEQDIFPDPAETLALVGLLQREYACFRRRTEKRDGGDCELKRMDKPGRE